MANMTERAMATGVKESLARIDSKMVTAVARRLGCADSDVQIVRHEVNQRYGYSVPVFGVPESLVDVAVANGLRAEHV